MEARTFSDGVAWVFVRAGEDRAELGYGLIDPAGKFVIEPRNYYSVHDFHEGLAAVRGPSPESPGLLRFLGVIDKTGRVVIPPRFAGVNRFSGGLAAAQVQPTWDAQAKSWVPGPWGYIDTRGEWVIEPRYDRAGDFSGGLASVGISAEGFGYIDRRGRRLGWCPK